MESDDTSPASLADLMNSPGMKAFRDHLQSREREFERVQKQLAAEGITGFFTTTACPVQFEGTLADGTHLYFRSRWDDARLEVWAPGVAHEKHYVDATGETHTIHNFDQITATYDADEQDFGMFEASWLEADEALLLIRALVARHRADA